MVTFKIIKKYIQNNLIHDNLGTKHSASISPLVPLNNKAIGL